MKISYLLSTLFASLACLPLSACAQVPFCHNPTAAKRSIANAKLLNINILGNDDRQPEEDFGKPENLEAQRILGLREIKKSISAVVPVECYWGTKGHYTRDIANGILACDNRTLIVNGHTLRNSLCKNSDIEFTCQIPDTPEYPERIGLEKPESKQLKSSDICSRDPENDLAVLKLVVPSKRTPLKIGTVSSFELIKGRKFVSVAANTSSNYKNKNTQKTFTVSQFDRMNSVSLARSDVDNGYGSSGEAHLIKQGGDLLVIGVGQGFYGFTDSNHRAIDGRPYSSSDDGNFSKSLFFSKDLQKFLRKNIENPDKCFRDVRPENEVSI